MSERFLFVIPTARIGGAERVMFNLVTYLLDQQKDVTLVTMSQGKQQNGWADLEKYVNFHWVIGDYKSEKASLAPITAKLISLSTKYEYDYIFSSHLHVNSYLSTLKKFGLFKGSNLISRESSVVFERNKGFIRIAFKLAYRFLYGEQDLLICQTELMKNSLIRNLGFKPVRKVEVLHNPVNIDYINSHISNTHKEKIIVACGRLFEIKQFDLLIDAFSIFSKRNPEHNLIILGEGALRLELEAQARSLKISEKVIFMGRVNNPFEWFAKSEIGVVSSRIEGFPNVILEMMASGTSKIVTTPCTGGLKEIPSLIITDDTSMNSILDGLNKAAALNDDLSPIYQKHIAENNSVNAFWDEVLQLLN